MTTRGRPAHDCVLVRYGELALKSRRVRARFTGRLKDTIVVAFQADDLDCVVEDDGGHLYVFSSDIPRAASRLSRVFGVVSVSPAARVELEGLVPLSERVAEYAADVLEAGQTFAVRSRRTGTHDFSSMDLARAAGAAIMGAFDGGLRVDLTDPEVEVHVEVRGHVVYVYHQRIPGVGGLPMGSQGRVLCPVHHPSDAVAAWMLMRRGCSAVLVVLEGDPVAAELTRRLMTWDPGLIVRRLPEGEWDWPHWYREMGRSRSLAVVSGVRGPGVPTPPLDRGTEPVIFFPLVGLDDDAYDALEADVLG